MGDSEGAPAEAHRRKSRIATNVLALLQTARQTYGLRTNDYARYHSHAVRRIASLSKSVGAAAGVGGGPSTSNKKQQPKAGSKNSSSSSKSSGSGSGAAKGQRLAALDAAALQRDERVLELLLWEAERAWAEGMRTREELAVLERTQTQQARAGAAGGAGAGGLARKRHRSQRRLCRASQHADRLAGLLKTLSSESVTAGTVLQTEIYRYILAGTYAFSLASSSSASSRTGSSKEGSSPSSTGAKHLATAYVLLEAFAKHSSRANDEALAFELLDELEPMVRFCAYKAELSSGSSVMETARSIGSAELEGDAALKDLLARHEQEEAASNSSGKNQQSQTIVKQIRWRDIDIPVKSAELSSALGKIQVALSQLQKSGKKTSSRKSSSAAVGAGVGDKAMARYDRALSTLSEAEERARKLVEDNATALSKAHSARFESATKPLGTAHSYIVFQLLSLRISRDEALLASALAKLKHREEKIPENKKGRGKALSVAVKRRRVKTYPTLIKLLDNMLQSLEQIRELDIVEEDSADLASHVDAKIAFEKARRCLYLAQVYALVDKYPESLSLSQRASLYIRQFRSSPLTFEELASVGSSEKSDVDAGESAPSNLGVAAFSIPQSSVEQLEAQLTQAEYRSKKDWFLFHHASEQATKVDQDDAAADAIGGLSLHAAGSQKNKKKGKTGPLFFDVAYNYVAGIDLESLLAASRGEGESGAPSQARNDTQPSIAQQAKDVVMETAAQAKEALVDASTSGSAANTPSKAAGGIWGFFGRGKK